MSADIDSCICAGGCGRTLPGVKGSLPSGRRMCRICRRSQWASTCSYCGEQMEPRTGGRKYCSRSCAARARYGVRPGIDVDEMRREWRRRKERRERYSKAVTDGYSFMEIAERDKFICGLCSRLVDVQLPYNDPFAATIDHVIPLSRGGGDVRSNVQLAHRTCNTAKGNRVLVRR